MLAVLLFVILLGLAFFIDFFRKLLFGSKESNMTELWKELDEQEWFQTISNDPKAREWIKSDKKTGLLSDPYFVRKIIANEVHRETFVRYIIEKTK